MTNEEAFEIIKPHSPIKELNSVSFVMRWKEYDVYTENIDEELGCIGFPYYILVDKNKSIRTTTVKEYSEISDTLRFKMLSMDELTMKDKIRLIQLSFDMDRKMELQHWGDLNNQEVYNILYEDCNHKPYPPHLVLIDNDKNCRFADEEETKSLLSAHLKEKRNASRPKPLWDVVPPEMRFKENAEIVEESPKLAEAKNRLPKLKFYKECHLAARQYYDADLVWDDLKVGTLVRLVRDEDNRHDDNAVAVMYDKGRKRRREEYHIGYIPSSENKEIATFLEMGWDNLFECRISKITPDAHYENQIRLTIRIRRNEDE